MILIAPVLKFMAWLGLPSWVLPVLLAGAASIALTFAYMKGYSTASAKCEAASLRVKIESLERDIRNAKEAERLEAEELAKLQKLTDDLEAEVAAYEIELASKPDNRCSLDQSDIDRLRGNGKR